MRYLPRLLRQAKRLALAELASPLHSRAMHRHSLVHSELERAPLPQRGAWQLAVAPTLHPLGRPVTLIAPSGSLVPTLSYRWPTHTLNAARSIAGPGLQQRVARFSDPEPVYDASGVERVFQGAPAPTELLEPNHSALAPALRHLSVATQPRQDALDAQPLLSTFNLAEKPKEGMLVHTWEWTTRDYAEPTLPGKRVRGVNEAEGSGRAGAGAMSGPDTPRAERGV